MDAYSSGDVYVWTAKQCGKIPKHISNEEAAMNKDLCRARYL